jgi:hypothetical protein
MISWNIFNANLKRDIRIFPVISAGFFGGHGKNCAQAFPLSGTLRAIYIDNLEPKSIM